MKQKYIFLSFLLLCVGCYRSQEKLIVEVSIDSSLRYTPQWLYWFALVGNEQLLLDSIYVVSTRERYKMETKINRSEEYFSWFTFEKEGPEQVALQLNPEDSCKIKVYLRNEEIRYVDCKGSLATEEQYKWGINRRMIEKNRSQLLDSLFFLKDENVWNKLNVEINKYSEYLSVGYFENFLSATQTQQNAVLLLDILNLKLQEKEFDKILLDVKKRFPNSTQIQDYPKRKHYPSESEKSKKITTRFRKILYTRHGFHKNESYKSFIDSLKTITPYRVGNKVMEIKLKGVSGNNVNLLSITSDYVLVDFWASWCIPCRKEIPHLRKAVENYPKELTVFAISFCNSEKEWRETIKKDNSEMFTHAYAGNFMKSKSGLLLKAQFGITRIPANFLLDKNRKVIAVDLRGEDLLNKMKEATKK